MSSRRFALLALLPLILLLALMPAYALIDLISPAENAATNTTSVTFDYYVSMPGMTACSLNLAGQLFPDPDAASNSMNAVQVQNLAPGTYAWSVGCTNGTQESSITRTIVIDTQAPTVALVMPQEGSTIKTLAVDFIPYDETAASLSCQVQWNNDLLETASVVRNTHYIKNYSGAPGNGTLAISCTDMAGNRANTTRNFTLLPDFGLQLQLDKQHYGLTEAPKLTINTLPGANVTVDICPDQAGFVQCTSALIDTSAFPQTFTLPVMNRTGSYIVDGIASYSGQTKLNRTTYNVTNTIQLSIERSASPLMNESFNLTASVSGGIAPYTLSWKMDNGTVIPGASVVTVNHAAAGNYTHTLTVTDAASNQRIENITYKVEPVYSVLFKVSDAQTGEAVVDAELDLTHESTNIEENVRTIQGGIAYAEMQQGVNRIFISAPEYEYFLAEYYINSSTTLEVELKRMPSSIPQVSITAPGDQGTVRSPVTISYSATHGSALTCTLLFGDSSNWFKPNGTTAGASGDFVRELAPGTYRTRVECADSQGRTGSSSVVTFTVSSSQPAAAMQEEQGLQDAMAQIDALITGMDGYGQKEREAITIIGFDRQLRNAKRAIQQAVRDINDLQYRQDLDDAAKLAERKRVLENVNNVIATTPVGLRVADSKSYVKYAKEEDMEEIAASLAGLSGIGQKIIAKQLWEDQQKFTMSTKVLVVEQLFADERVETSTIVTKSFTYAQDIGPEYQLYEIIPAEVAKSAQDITLVTKAEVVKDDLVLRYGQEQAVTYIIPKRVDFVRLEDIKTVLARPYAQDAGMITGFAVFSGDDLAGASWPVIAIVLFILVAYLVYYFDLVKQAKYLIYRFSKKEKVHYVRVIISDAVGQLDANNYEKAEMLYKEVRMTYDSLPVPAKNELYDDVMDLVHRMDSYYFNLVMIELDGHLKASDMPQAIACYEKLTHIYERLDTERQQQLVQTVIGMAKRLGLEVAA